MLTEKKMLKKAGFEIGHPRVGGRQRKSTQVVRDLCAEMDCDPMAFMIGLIRDGTAIQVVIENGKKKRVEVSAPLDMRADLAKYVSKFLYPTLTATALTGDGGGPVEVATLSITKVMADPHLVSIAQQLALSLIADNPAPSQPLALPAPQDPPTPDAVVIDVETGSDK